MHALNHDAEEQAYRAEQRKLNRERRRRAWEALDGMVRDKTHPSHFHASKETLNRIDGMPTAKTKVEGTLSLESLVAASLKKPDDDTG